MPGTARSLILLLCCVVLLTGCRGARTTPATGPVVQPPGAAMPAEDTPPPHDEDYSPAVPDEDMAALLYQARLDLLRLLICSEESIQLSDGTYDSDVLLQKASEHFTDMGFRVIDGSPCPDYDASATELGFVANQRDVDMFVLLRAQAKPYDKFGDFYLFEAEARGKVAQISDSELLTTKTSTVRGKREQRENTAAESALAECGQELAHKLCDEILRKSGRGPLLRRVRVDGLPSARYVDYVRVELSAKPGIRSVVLRNWDEVTRAAVFWVRMDADVKENLAAYLEQLRHVKLRVERLDKTGVDSRQ